MEAPVAAALGQAWVLGHNDSTVRVAGQPSYCLDVDQVLRGQKLITYPCNRVSIEITHNQQFR